MEVQTENGIQIEFYCKKHYNIPINTICLECEQLFCPQCYIIHLNEKKHDLNPMDINKFFENKCNDLEKIIHEVQRNNERVVKSLQITAQIKGKMLDKTDLTNEFNKIISKVEKIFATEFEKRAEFAKALTKNEGLLLKQSNENLAYVHIFKDQIKNIKKGNFEEKVKFVLGQFMQKKAGKRLLCEEVAEKLKIPEILPIPNFNADNSIRQVEALLNNLSHKIKQDSEALVHKTKSTIIEMSKEIAFKLNENDNRVILSNDFEKKKSLIDEVKEFKEKMTNDISSSQELIKIKENEFESKIQKTMNDKFDMINEKLKEVEKIKYEIDLKSMHECCNCKKLSCLASLANCVECNKIECLRCSIFCDDCGKENCPDCIRKCSSCDIDLCKKCAEKKMQNM